MITKVFSVFDAKMATFSTPFFEQTTASAVRSFRRWVNTPNENNMLFNNPEDFHLYEIGEFDNEKGELMTALVSAVVSAAALKDPVPSQLNLFENNKGEKEPVPN